MWLCMRVQVSVHRATQNPTLDSILAVVELWYPGGANKFWNIVGYSLTAWRKCFYSLREVI